MGSLENMIGSQALSQPTSTQYLTYDGYSFKSLCILPRPDYDITSTNTLEVQSLLSEHNLMKERRYTVSFSFPEPNLAQ